MWRTVCDAWPVRRQTYDYLPSHRASPPNGWYQIILLGDRDTCVLTTSPGLHSTAGRLQGSNPRPRPTDRKSSVLTTRPPSHTYHTIWIASANSSRKLTTFIQRINKTMSKQSGIPKVHVSLPKAECKIWRDESARGKIRRMAARSRYILKLFIGRVLRSKSTRSGSDRTTGSRGKHRRRRQLNRRSSQRQQDRRLPCGGSSLFAWIFISCKHSWSK